MRLEFNYIIVDDDFKLTRTKRRAEDIVKQVNAKIESRGFVAKSDIYKSLEEFLSNKDNLESKNRVDLYLSDNNLGNTGSTLNKEHANDGIELYLTLHKEFLCDFVLYTGSTKDVIIDKLVEHLQEQQDPGLFSRFTFVSRSPDLNENWVGKIEEVIDLIISHREEMNNFRGLFAEKIARMDVHLKSLFAKQDSEGLKETIKNIPKNKFADSSINESYLHRLRCMRNGLLHNNEEYDEQKQEYKIAYEVENSNGRSGRAYIFESDFSKERKKLQQVYDEVMSWE